MSVFYMSDRGQKLLNVLLGQTDYISLNSLAKALDVSRRTIYYDISKVNIWLENMGMPALEVVREKGIFISDAQKDQIRKLLESDEDEQVYIFSPMERCKGIICYIIYSGEAVYMEQLTECFQVSRNTVFKDLKEVTAQLEKYDLVLDYQPKSGYRIEGETVRVRALFLLYFSELLPLFKSGRFLFFQPKMVENYYEKLMDIEKSLKINYVDGVLFSLAALVPLLYRHRNTVVFPGMKALQVQKTKEYELIGQYFPDLLLEEQCYLALHLLGSRVNMVPTDFFANPSRQYLRDLVQEFVTEFEKTACVIFEDKQELEKALFVHLSTSLYRYLYGIQIGNTMGDDVIKEYPDLFAITRKAVKRLECTIGSPIPDGEVAYLALHFGSALKISERDNKRLRILIVCVNGMSTGNMIKREVQKLLPFAEIVAVKAAVDLMNVQEICDLIITTVKVNCVVPSIIVHPILSELDRKNILNHKLIAPKQIEIKRDQLFQVVKKYVDPEQYENLKDDLTVYLQGGTQEFQMDDKLELGLSKLLDGNRIQIFKESCGWQQSIRKAGQCLIDCGSIEPRYLDSIISQLQYYGPYMFLTDSVILAHAKPEDGVNTLDISLSIFKEPVAFSAERKAKIVIVLAAEDQEKHLKILQDILSIVGDTEATEDIAGSNTSNEILSKVNEYISLHR